MKIIIAITAVLAVLGLSAGGFFYWWNEQADVRELNKTLPQGVRVAKSLFANEYKVLNKIDGYEFKVPREWEGIRGVEYIAEREEMGFRGSNINIFGIAGQSTGMGIYRFKVEDGSELIDWAKNMFQVVGLVGEFSVGTVGDFAIVKTQENAHLGGAYMYFLKKNSIIYAITNGSEEFVKYVILNGKW